jgi:hypothetical protein
MKIHKDLQQGTDAWFKARELKGTASHATAIRARGAGLETYCREVVRNYLSSSKEEAYSGKATEHGTDLEPHARQVYMFETGNSVEEVGFIEYNDFIGCSPDGLIGEEGDLEIKCPYSDKVYFDYIIDSKVPSDYYNQCQMRLLIEGRKWCDLFIYNPNFEKTYILHKIYPDEKAFAELKEGFVMFENRVKELLEIYNKK